MLTHSTEGNIHQPMTWLKMRYLKCYNSSNHTRHTFKNCVAKEHEFLFKSAHSAAEIMRLSCRLNSWVNSQHLELVLLMTYIPMHKIGNPPPNNPYMDSPTTARA